MTVHLPENLSDVGYGAFYGCLNISAFDIASSNPTFSSQMAFYTTKVGMFLCCIHRHAAEAPLPYPRL